MNRNLTQGPVLSTVFSLSIPMTWGMMSVITFNIADTYFIGQLGTTELAAMSLTFPVAMIFYSLALGTSTAVSSVVSRTLGENDFSQVKRYTSDGLTFALLSVIILVLISYFTLEPVFTLLGATDQTLPLIKEYMEVWLPGMIFLTVPMAGNGAIRAAGQMKVASTIMLISAITNIILDPLFIFGWGSFPAFGIQGAAIATVISRALTLIASLYFLGFRLKMLDFKLPKFKQALYSWKKILHIAIPTTGTNLLAPIAIAVATGVVARLGEAEIAAYGVVSRVESFAMIYIYALSTAIAPIFGQTFGARKFARLSKILNASYFLLSLWCCGVAIILFFFGGEIMELFNKNSRVIEVGKEYLLWVPISFVFLALRLIISSFYNAIGKPFISVVLGFLNLICLFIPLVLVGADQFGMQGVIYAHFLTNLLIGIISWIIVSLQLKNKKLLP